MRVWKSAFVISSDSQTKQDNVPGETEGAMISPTKANCCQGAIEKVIETATV